MTTVLPEKYKPRATTTRPALGERMGVPAGLRKSAPPCALRGLPLNTLRVPNALFAGCGTGRVNGSGHSRVGGDPRHVAAISRESAAIRSAADGGGVTKFSSTVSRRVRNVFL